MLIIAIKSGIAFLVVSFLMLLGPSTKVYWSNKLLYHYGTKAEFHIMSDRPKSDGFEYVPLVQKNQKYVC